MRCSTITGNSSYRLKHTVAENFATFYTQFPHNNSLIFPIVDQLKSGLHLVGGLGWGVRVSASFQIFVLWMLLHSDLYIFENNLHCCCCFVPLASIDCYRKLCTNTVPWFVGGRQVASASWTKKMLSHSRSFKVIRNYSISRVYVTSY